MQNQITTYVPQRNRFGQFKSIKFRKLAKKTIKWQIVILSIILNIWFVRHDYVVTCAAGGHFMSKQECGNIAQAKADSQTINTELARIQMIEQNPDLFTK